MAFLSEMRHPMDFWKAMLCAQLFISIVYIFFGVFVSPTHVFRYAHEISADDITGLQLLRPILLCLHHASR